MRKINHCLLIISVLLQPLFNLNALAQDRSADREPAGMMMDMAIPPEHTLPENHDQMAPSFDELTKEQQRAKWYSEDRYTQYLKFNRQYRLDAFRKIKKDSSRISIQQWESLGPHDISGRLKSIALHPSDENILWVGSASGGLWKSETGGNSWHHVTGNLPAMAIHTIAVHPAFPEDSTMFIGTSMAAALKAFGASESTKQGAGVFISRSISKNGRNDWKEAGLTGTRPHDNEGKLVDSNKLVWDISLPDLVYLASSNGLWRYHVKKNRWEEAFKGDASAFMDENVVTAIINKKEPEVIITAIKEKGVLRSNNNGQTWELFNNGLPDFENNWLLSLTQSHQHPHILYASVLGKRLRGKDRKNDIYRTSDGGKTWKQQSTTSQSVQVLEVSPSDPSLLLAGGIELLRSRNNAARWDTVRQQRGCFEIVYVDQKRVAFSKTNPDLVYALNDGGVYKSRDRGKCWKAHNDGLKTVQIYSLASSPHDPLTLSIGTQDHGTLITSDGGKVWTKRVSGDGGITLFDTQSKDTVYTSGTFGNRWKVVRGKDPRRISRGINNGRRNRGKDALWIAPFAMDPSSSNILYTANFHNIFRSVNGGERWMPVNNSVKLDTISIITTDIQKPSLVYAYAKKSGKIFRSFDNGEHWEAPECKPGTVCTPGKNVLDLKADPNEHRVLYAARATKTNQVWRSTNAGESWEDITTMAYADLELPVQAIAIRPRTASSSKQIYIGTDVGVFMRRENETDWTFMGGDAPYAIVTQMHYSQIDNTIRIGTFGQGVWKMNAPD